MTGALAPNDYAIRFGEPSQKRKGKHAPPIDTNAVCAAHMLPKPSPYVLDQKMLPVTDQGWHCTYPGGYVSAGLWDVRAWYAHFDKYRPEADRRPLEQHPAPYNRPYAIRIFDYDDGDLALYFNDKAEAQELWDTLCALDRIDAFRDLKPLGFRQE